MAFKKKLHAFRPSNEPPTIFTRRTKRLQRREPCDPASIERGVRQRLADKVSGTMVGLWLLIPEHLRLGTWDLLCGWTQCQGDQVQPRLALQAVHEAALCLPRFRRDTGLTQKGLELANGLPFIATDQAIHDLFDASTIEQTQGLQMALGRLRRARGHFLAKLLAVDPHHRRSYTQRQTRRHRHKEGEAAVKTLQTIFCLDAHTHQPVAFTIASAARTTSQAVPELLDMARDILQPPPRQTLVIADNEHLTADIFQHVLQDSPFDLLSPMPRGRSDQERLARIPPDLFVPRWAGLAIARLPYQFHRNPLGPLYQLVQRCGETPDNYHYAPFLSTSQNDELDLLCRDYPDRWHIEEFFNAYQAMGWNRAGTLNLHIRYAQLTMALIAQAALHQLRQRLGEPYQDWEAGRLSKLLLQGLDGDIRVDDNTVLVTFYNAPNAERLRQHYENLPHKLQAEHVNPTVPWLYGYKLDFRFK